MARATPSQRALALVKKHLGVDARESGDRVSFLYVAPNDREYCVSWSIQACAGKEQVVGVRTVDLEHADATWTAHDDYDPGHYHDTVEKAIKWLLRREKRDRVEDAQIEVRLRHKGQAGFRRMAIFEISRFCDLEQTSVSIMSNYQLTSPVRNQFVSVTVTLDDDDAIRMATGFCDGEIPAVVLLDWLREKTTNGCLENLLSAKAGVRQGW